LCGDQQSSPSQNKAAKPVRGNAPRLLQWVLGALSAALLACNPARESVFEANGSASVAPTHTASAEASAPVEVLSGPALLEKYECNRCHEGTYQPALPTPKHCVRCHAEIVDGTFSAPRDALLSWRPHVSPLRFAPSLQGLGTLVSREWAAEYLTHPTDLRPHLVASMPRLAISKPEAVAIVDYLASRNASEISPVDAHPPHGDAEAGRSLFQQKACNSCHQFTGAGVAGPTGGTSEVARELALAPDLRHARARVMRENLVAYLLRPDKVKPGAAMPNPQLSEQEANHLARFILEVPLLPEPTQPPLKRLPLLERPVGYEEVAARVLHKTCWHCHSQPDYARGDGGPGNTGGFGFAPRKLDLSSYESISSGLLDRNGERKSVFTTTASGRPLLVQALLARHEEARGAAGEVRGMPLGLPPLSAEEIQLVESWVEQGHPR
jgi:cytochrome c2